MKEKKKGAKKEGTNVRNKSDDNKIIFFVFLEQKTLFVVNYPTKNDIYINAIIADYLGSFLQYL